MRDYRKSDATRGFYRSRHGVIFGVCRGVADYFDISVFWLRLILIVAFLFTGFFPVGVIYLVAALLLKPAPVVPFETASDREFYDTCTRSRGLAIDRLKQAFDRIERRVERMESAVTSRDYRWDEKLGGNR